MAQNGLNDWADIAERLGGWIVAGAGTLAVFWRRIRRLFDILRAGDGLHREFGPDAATQIRAMLERVTRSTDELQVRQKIAEQHLRIGIYICRPDGRCSWANDYLCELFGRSQDQMHGFGWIDAVHDDDRKRVYEEWHFATENVLPYRTTYAVVHGGDVVPVKTEAFAVTHGKRVDGDVVFYVGFVIEDR